MYVWSDYLSDADNLEVKSNLVCASFSEFINGLVENYLDEEYELDR